MGEMAGPAQRVAGQAADAGLPFVGRAHELERIRILLDAAIEGAGRTLLIGGEPGIGKSRLVEQVRRRAEVADFAVLWGWCWQASASVPLWPWRRLLRAAVDEGLLDPSTFGPSLRRHLAGAGPAPSDQDDGTARLELFSDVAAAIQVLARRRPTLVVVDDLHVADQVTLLLFEFLARELVDRPVLLVGTRRLGSHQLDDDVEQVLDRIGHVAERIDLRPLEPDDVDRAAEAALGIDAANHVHRLRTASRGHPLLLVANLALIAAGRPLHEGGDIGVPAAITRAIQARFADLPPDTARMCALAAVWGLDVDAALLARSCDRPPADVVSALDPAVDAGIVEALGAGRLRFPHVLVRDVAYHMLTEAERRQAHLDVADVLEVTGRDEHTTSMLAHHLLSAVPLPDARRVVGRLREAAASRNHAHEAAVDLLEAALGLGADLEVDERCDLLLELGSALQRAGSSRSEAVHLQAVDLARSAGDGRRFAAAVLGLTEDRQFGLPDRRRLELLDEALGRVPDDADLQARLLVRLTVERHSAGQLDSLGETSERAVVAAERAGDPAARLAALEARRFALHQPRNILQRLAVDNEMVELAQSIGDDRLVLRARELRLLDLLQRADGPAVRVEVAAHGLLSEQLRLRLARAQSRFLAAMLALAEGRFEVAERMGVEGHELGRAVQPRIARRTMQTQQLLARRLRGGLEEYEPVVTDALAEFPVGHLPADAVLAMFHAELDRDDRAAVVLERAWPELLGLDGQATSPVLATFADAVVLLGDRRRAEQLVPLLLPWRGLAAVHGRGAVYGGAMAFHTGRLLALTGDRDGAVELLEEGVALDARMGAEVLVARGWAGLAEVLLGGGAHQRGRAEALLVKAEEAARDLGAHRLARTVRGQLARTSRGARAVTVVPPQSSSTRRVVREGEYWTIVFDGAYARVRDRKGLRQLVELLRRPGRDVPATWLAATADGRRPGPDDDPQHARVNVTRSIRTAIQRLEPHLPELAAHLQSSIHTGTSCRYAPDPRETGWSF